MTRAIDADRDGFLRAGETMNGNDPSDAADPSVTLTVAQIASGRRHVRGLTHTAARVHVKANFEVAGLSPASRVSPVALKRCGMILADNGRDFSFQSACDERWDEAIDELKRVPASAFEALEPGPLPPWARVRAPAHRGARDLEATRVARTAAPPEQ